MPLVDDLQGRIAELTQEMEKQGPELAEAKREVTRLRAEMTTLKTAHSADLKVMTDAQDALRAERDAAVAARDGMRAERDEAQSARDAIRADWDDHIAKYLALEKSHEEETVRLRRRAKNYCDTMMEMDTLLSGKLPLLPSSYAKCFPFLSCFSHLPS